ncbi:MAG: helix-hairpin-helix domain-containing protein, partial [Flavobacteriaceae bacterium]|nr:helix-hairpin-helix domain-containing protein [Flavobacteriaceae bacterium]
TEPTSYISRCPECNTELVRKEGEAQHYCPNYNGCPPQIIGRIEHFISRKAMDIEGLGVETVALLVEAGLINNYADLYKLTKEDVLPLERIADKSAENMIKGIAESKSVPFERVLFALGIRYVGETVAKKLARHFQSIHALASASFDELTAVNEIGERIAESVLEFFASEENRKIVKQLEDFGLNVEISQAEAKAKSDKLDGKAFVVSGVFESFSRDELKKAIEDNGGKVVSSISSKTSYVIAGENMGPSKKEKAEKLSIPIITESDFINMTK